MSANDQILGNVDGGEAQEPTSTPAVDDTADSSSQKSGVDGNAVGNDATSSAPRLVGDPSVPLDGAHPLTALPAELLRMITADLDTIGHHSVRLSCKTLRAQVDAPPLMSHGDYLEFHRQLENHSLRKVKSLLCHGCTTFKDPTASKRSFTDAQAVQKHGGGRICIECGIANGHYDKRDVVIKKKKLFVCGGCKLMLTHEKEEKAVADVVVTKGYPYRDDSWGKGAEITITSGGKRWCKPCRVAIAGLGESGAIKVKSVYMS